MSLFEKLKLDIENIDWENNGIRIDTTKEGIVVVNNITMQEIYAIKRVSNDIEKEKFDTICEDIAWEYCLKEIGEEKLSYMSDLVERRIVVRPIMPCLHLKRRLIGRCPYNPNYLNMFRESEIRLKALYPLGYRCFKLFLKDDPAYVYIIREYTRKMIRNTYYPRGEINKGLHHRKLQDLPEDILMDTLVKILPSIGDQYSKWDVIENLNKLPYKVKDKIRYHGQKFMTGNFMSMENASEEVCSIDKTDLIHDIITVIELEQNFKPLLTSKEFDVIHLILQDLTDTEIAKQLGISRQSVGERKKNAISKIRTASIIQYS